jgi:chromosome segregation ATPase
MKETFRSKLEEQNNLIDELKTELESSIARNQEYHSSLSNGNQEIKQLKDKLQNQTEEKQRLDNQVQTLGR